MTNLDAERLARAFLLRVAEPPAPALADLVAQHGPITAAKMVRAGECSRLVNQETAARRSQDLAEHDLAIADRLGIRLVIPEDGEWPAWPLLSLAVATGRGVSGVAPPLGLWVRGSGRLDQAATQALAIVGARTASSYGEQLAAEFAYGLVGHGVPIFSGAAYGIDGAAHRGALAAAGSTVAVLACGLDMDYPAGHTVLLNNIAERGLVLSEYPPGTRPARHRFLVRNRLIAALTDGTIVIEAGIRSGAKNTASTANTLGKLMMAVPGPVSSAMSAGCHQLIRDSGALLVCSVADVLAAIGNLAAQPETPNAPRRNTDRLNGHALQVYEALPHRSGKSTEQLAEASGVPVEKVRAILPALEIAELAQRCDMGWRRRPTRPAHRTDKPSVGDDRVG